MFKKIKFESELIAYGNNFKIVHAISKRKTETPISFFDWTKFYSFIYLDPIEPNGEEEENGKPFKCQRPGCKAAFCNKGNLRRHIVEVHEGKKRSDTSFISKEQPEEESFDFAGKIDALFISNAIETGIILFLDQVAAVTFMK